MNLPRPARYVPGVDPDRRALAAVAQGDEGALRELYDRHAGAVLRLLRRLTSDAGTAEEIMQESWLAVWRSADTFRGASSVRGWILGVARRKAHDRLRRAGPATVALDGEEAPDPADAGADVEAEVLAAAGHREILTAIGALPRRHREVVHLALVEELPYPEIAEVLGIPVGTVKSRMSKARARLAGALRRGLVS